MSVTQDYKENNLATFTFTPDEVKALAVGVYDFAHDALFQSIVSRIEGREEDAAALVDLSVAGMTAYEKLVRQ